MLKTSLYSMNKIALISQFRCLSSKMWQNMPQFKSDYSLDKVYPNSVQQTDRLILEPMSENDEKFSGHIPMDKLDITYCKSSGPGGSHVNTTNTKATIKFHLASADWIPHKARQLLSEIHKNNINKDGFWIIRSDKTRAQLLNVADCMDKLRCYITEATQPIPTDLPETLEMKREKIEKAAYRRLEQKRMRSIIKRDRRSTD